MKMNKTLMIGLMIALAVVLAACQITVQQPKEQQANTISVNGNAQFKVAPDEATVMVRVEANGTTAKEAQDKNSVAMAAVQDALKNAGIGSDELSTLSYNVYPNSYWDYKEQRQIESGFKASHTLQFKTKDLEKVGNFIQVAVDAGATNVDSVNFALSTAKDKDAKNEALRQATQDARQKAEALADGLGMKLGKVSSVSINEYNIIPYMRGGIAYAEAGMMEKMPAPDIQPQDVDVSANVQVVFEIA